MMKIQILIALSAVAALSSAANAQTQNNGDGVQLRDIPELGKSFPNLSGNRLEGTRLEMLNSNLVVFIVRQDSGQALRQLAKVLGVKIVIDPEIKFLPPKTRSLTFNKLDEDVFGDVSRAIIRTENIEMVKSPLGTYFFATKPAPPSGGSSMLFQMPNGTWQRFERLPQDAPYQLPGVPFTLEPGENLPHIDPDFVWPKNFGRVQPLPYGEKREFNGRPFYNMPMPVPGWPAEKFSNPYVLPLPQRGPIK